MKNEHILYWLWLTGHFGTDAAKLLPLISDYGSVKALYEATEYDVASATVKKLSEKNLSWAEKTYEACLNKGIGIITYEDEDYPSMLKNIYMPPLVLYTRGKVPDWNKGLYIGVVGTRRATEYGIRATRDICTDLSKSGVTIVSGFAKGIDASALRSAIDAGGMRVSVLGAGIDVAYPAGHTALYKKVLEHGFIMTEYPPETKPSKWTFPKRNRIIAGLCRGVLVIEAPEKSGALITARLAADEGRDVFAVPGNIDTKNAKGVNKIIKEGAFPVTQASDILDEYPDFSPKVIKQEKPQITVSRDEDFVLEVLAERDFHIDELIRILDIPVNRLNNILLILEIGGYVTRISGNTIRRIK